MAAEEKPAVPIADAWSHLRRFTPARIAIGRTGGSQPTSAVLDFRLAHARARDAVIAEFHPAVVAAALTDAGLIVDSLTTAAQDRRTFLLRPDLGRRLSAESRQHLAQLAPSASTIDLVIIISDGLAAAAAERHAAATLIPLAHDLGASGWKIGPVFIVPFARVKLQDEVGSLLRARFSLILLGERPGLGTPDSLGAYLTAEPAPERTDADRNCLSNIRPDGLPPAQAAEKLAWLLRESDRTGRRGIQLKDEQPAAATAGLPTRQTSGATSAD